jgi:hypothetical protein
VARSASERMSARHGPVARAVEVRAPRNETKGPKALRSDLLPP